MDTKLWWQSRTIWVQIVAATFAVLAVFHVLPAGIDQEQVVGAVMLVVAAASAALRVRTTAVIAPATTPPPDPYRFVSTAPGRQLSEPVPTPPVEPAPVIPQPDQPQETATMTSPLAPVKTFVVEAEQDVLDKLKAAGSVLKEFVISEPQKLVAEFKQSDAGTTILNYISLLSSHSISGAEKMAKLLPMAIDLIQKVMANGGLKGLLVAAADFALEVCQSLYNDFKAAIAKVAAAHADTAAA